MTNEQKRELIKDKFRESFGIEPTGSDLVFINSMDSKTLNEGLATAEEPQIEVDPCDFCESVFRCALYYDASGERCCGQRISE